MLNWLLLIMLWLAVIYLYRKAFYPKYDGDVIISRHPDGKTSFSLDLNSDPYDIHKKGRLTFKVVKELSDEIPEDVE